MKPLNILLFATLLSLVATAGCSAAPATAEPRPPAAQTTQAATPAAPPGSRAGSVGPAAPDATCRIDADCTVKNVGNCCGAFPACINVASTVDPAAVQAQCRASGRMSVCGFREITGCQCVQGQCTAKSSGADTLRRPVVPTEPLR